MGAIEIPFIIIIIIIIIITDGGTDVVTVCTVVGALTQSDSLTQPTLWSVTKWHDWTDADALRMLNGNSHR